FILKFSMKQNHVQMDSFESDIIKRGDKNYLSILGCLRKMQSKGMIVLEGRRRRGSDNFNPVIQIDDFVFSRVVLGEDTYSKVDFSDVYSVLEAADDLIDRRCDEKIGEDRFFNEFDNLCERISDKVSLKRIIDKYGTIEKAMIMRACVTALKSGRSDDLNNFISEIFSSLKSVARASGKIYEGRMPCFKDKVLKLEESGGFFGMMGSPDFVLTEKYYEKIFESKIKRKKNDLRTVYTEHIKSSKISKELFFDPELKGKVDVLVSALDGKKFAEVTKKLKNSGFAPGLVSLLHGYPGTGKTATVHEIARRTKRDVLQVDISNINDKFVGESEKRLKEVFNEYKKAKKCLSKTPILLFNEADALIGRRINVKDSVDQMNNNMQNILLEELEKFDGIFFATTNMTHNMDDAFNRRFLYKIEFKKPSAAVRMKIWKSKMKDIPQKWIKELSAFDLTGGQIDNIVRKYMIDSILLNTGSLTQLMKMCSDEVSFKKESSRMIGFGKR
ncbi:MAG: ATP-binding protein, partial [Candidatus Delongbacteria bacterium]|nr:ATP-binding protein [Candidatus Delongbacteria bacterium]